MRKSNLRIAVLSAMLSASMVCAPILPALACSRAVYIHHGRPYQVMTSSPIYDQQLVLNE